MRHGGDEFDVVLEALAADRLTEFGAPGVRIDVVRRIDGPFSAVRHVRIRTPTSTKHAYIKIAKAGEDREDQARAGRTLEREFRATLAFHAALRQDEEFGAVRAVAWLPEHRALVTEEVSGRPFGHVLRTEACVTDELRGIARRVGRWVHLYQQTGEPGKALEVRECREYLDTRLRFLVSRVISPGERRAALDEFDRFAAELDTRTLDRVPIHADLTPTNIIVGDRGRVTVLDFTMAQTGTLHHDLSHVYFHIELMARRHPRRRDLLRALQQAVLSGYDPGLTAAHPLFRMMLLQHGACHVAQLAERRLPLIDAAYRWFMRHRWRLCEQMVGHGQRSGRHQEAVTG